ncbi:cell wall-binding repeat-containing protein [Peptostreptococcus faecalis]|uniref:cell wall-binding repeat-containing protein n=1 Tax=Peptostreptococcus faecalis TaxID=2045015 RepID=UPI000C7A0316|nr:cell wall-binding repeat-containing protein [Peptostreptococcus faecalis]
MKKRIFAVAMSSLMIGGIGFSDIVNAETNVTKGDILYITRYSGNERFQTAIDLSKGNFKENTKNLIIVNGNNPADALSGGPLAVKLDAPILLATPTKIEADTIKEIKRLNPEKVYILGGNNSISQSVENTIKSNISNSSSIERISGNDRYETSMEVAKKITGTSTANGAGFVNGATNKFPDALSSAALLGAKDMPLILTDGKTLPTAAQTYKSNSKNYIIGGTDTINISGLSGKKISGGDRYETSAKVAEEGFKHIEYDYSLSENKDKRNSCVVVDGRNFPDALTAISASKKNNAPILLVNKDLPTSINKYITDQKRDRAYIVGGLNSVNSTVQTKLINKLEENYKLNRDNEETLRQRALREIKSTIEDNNKLVELIGENTSNKTKLDAYKALSKELKEKYVDNASSVKEVAATINTKKSELNKKLDEVLEIADSQYYSKLDTAIKEAEKLIPSKNPSSAQKDLSSEITSAKTLLNETNSTKNKEKLQKILKLKELGNKIPKDTLDKSIKSADEVMAQVDSLGEIKKDIDEGGTLLNALTDSSRILRQSNTINKNGTLEQRDNQAKILDESISKLKTEFKKYKNAVDKVGIEEAKNELKEEIKKSDNLLNKTQIKNDLLSDTNFAEKSNYNNIRKSLEKEISSKRTQAYELSIDNSVGTESIKNIKKELEKINNQGGILVNNTIELINLNTTINNCEESKKGLSGEKTTSSSEDAKKLYEKTLKEAKEIKIVDVFKSNDETSKIKSIQEKLNSSYKNYEKAHNDAQK